MPYPAFNKRKHWWFSNCNFRSNSGAGPQNVSETGCTDSILKLSSSLSSTCCSSWSLEVTHTSRPEFAIQSKQQVSERSDAIVDEQPVEQGMRGDANNQTCRAPWVLQGVSCNWRVVGQRRSCWRCWLAGVSRRVIQPSKVAALVALSRVRA